MVKILSPFWKRNFNIVFFVKHITVEPSFSFAITIYFCYEWSVLLPNKRDSKNAVSPNWSCITTRENFEPTKKTFWVHKIPPRKKKSDPRNAHEKKIGTREIPTRKNMEPTKYSREKILDPRNIHKGTMTLDSSFNTLLLYCISKDFLHEASVLWKKYVYETIDSVDLRPS